MDMLTKFEQHETRLVEIMLCLVKLKFRRSMRAFHFLLTEKPQKYLHIIYITVAFFNFYMKP